jgi:DNA topoisomerase 2-associated protein PAT1
MRYAAQNPPGRMPVQQQKPAKPKRTGYEYIPHLEADADLWGIPSKKDPEQDKSARKAMTLEEVEAMMLAQSAQQPPQQVPIPFPTQAQHQQAPAHPQILQRPPQPPQQQFHQQQQPQHQGPEAYSQQPPQILQRPHQPQQDQSHSAPTGPRQHRQQQSGGQHQGPRQILQNPNRQPGGPQQAQFRHGHAKAPSYGGQPTPAQIANLSEADRAAYLQEEARRAKRNHKIHALSKHNGLMTPQDKNFITRIQLQQLLTATGTVDAVGPDGILNEDFYYQVFSQIRGAPRQNPHQPANQFAQTYLFQTGGRYGNNRRHPRGGENHMQRMEQQVARAVEAARAKPKNSQLIIEGSLGKIAFSNSKTPKPLLNIKKAEGDSKPVRKIRGTQDAAADRRETLSNIEKVYAALMAAEDMLRHEPREPGPAQEEWANSFAVYGENLWKALKADVPLNMK